MSSARRRQQARDVTERARSLDPEQLGRVMIPLFVNALVTSLLRGLSAVVAARAVRRARTVRGRGAREMVRAAMTPALLAIPIALAYGPLSHAWVVRRLLRQLPPRSTE